MATSSWFTHKVDGWTGYASGNISNAKRSHGLANLSKMLGIRAEENTHARGDALKSLMKTVDALHTVTAGGVPIARSRAKITMRPEWVKEEAATALVMAKRTMYALDPGNLEAAEKAVKAAKSGSDSAISAKIVSDIIAIAKLVTTIADYKASLATITNEDAIQRMTKGLTHNEARLANFHAIPAAVKEVEAAVENLLAVETQTDEIAMEKAKGAIRT